MLKVLGYESLDAFVDDTIPRNVRIDELGDKDDGKGLRSWSELELRRRAEEVAAMNKGMKSYIGMGWVDLGILVRADCLADITMRSCLQ